MSITVRRVFTARGEVLNIEPESDPNACFEGEEIAGVDVEMPEGTTCDVCGEPIKKVKNKK
jgi:hypothetical protein